MSEVPYDPRRNSPVVRATDEDRAAVIAMITSATEDGRLRLEELDERLDTVHAAKTHGELADAVADLVPSPPTPRPASASSLEPRVSDRTILPAVLLCCLFGIFGAHRFYAGRIRYAIVMLALFFLTAGVAPAIAMIVDLIVLTTRSFRDGSGRVMRNWV